MNEDLNLDSEKKKNSLPKIKPALIGLICLAVAGVAAAFVLFSPGGVLGTSTRSGTATDAYDQKTIDELAKLMVLPDETPSIATVLDKTKLADQPFFARAENDDKLILYTQAGKAILYRPTTKQIVEVMPLILPGTNSDGVSGN
jgi:hypothetical protein